MDRDELRRQRRHRRVRKKVAGSIERPRLVVHRSVKHIQGHLVDDDTGKVLLGIGSVSVEVAQAVADELRKAEEAMQAKEAEEAAGDQKDAKPDKKKKKKADKAKEDKQDQVVRADKTMRSRVAGRLLAEKARAAGYTRVCFDRGGYRYHGRVAAFAEGAREGGLEF